jgi:mono/diheme cytochrome c family protein
MGTSKDLARLVAVGLVLGLALAAAGCAPFPLRQENRVKEEPAAESTPASSTSATTPADGSAGAEIYRTGMTAMGPIPFTGGDSTAVASCARCHGIDGKGGTAPDITWPVLTKAGYNRDTVVRAITKGVNEKGKPLPKEMPRFAPSKADLDALVAYLQTLK